MELILDYACSGLSKKDGGQQIPFYIKGPKSNETKICNVDAMIIKENKIRIIIEIEESANEPTQVCGKYLTSALSQFYTHTASTSGKECEIKLDKSSVLFIEVIDTKKFKILKPDEKGRGTDKPEQLKHIENAINDLISDAKNDHGCIKKYKLIQINGKELHTGGSLFDELRKTIVDEMKKDCGE
jgi:hypothetical protein